MSINRWSARRDAAEKPIVAALRAVGADVTLISGEGAPDILVRVRGTLVAAFEIKTGKGRQTEAQRVTGWPIVRTPDEALKLIGVK